MRGLEFIGVWLLALSSACPLLAQDSTPQARDVFPFYGTVTGSSVRLRGGPGDFHAILSELDQKTVLKVHGLEGSWYEVEIPGGLPLFVSSGRDGNRYVEEESPGRGIVRATSLNVRGDRSTSFPPVTQLKSGARVLILDGAKGWLRIMAPADTRAWVHHDYVKQVPDQKAAETVFLQTHIEAERRLLEGGARSMLMLRAEAEQARRKVKARKTFATYDQEKAKGVGQRDVVRLRAELVAVRDAAAPGDQDHARAAALLETLDDWTRLKKGWQDLASKRKLAAREANAHYSEELAALRREMETKRKKEEARRATRNSKNGWIRRVFPIKGVLNHGPNFALYRGDQKQFLLESERYDLADFTDKLVLVIKAQKPETRSGLPIRVLKVEKLEILDS